MGAKEAVGDAISSQKLGFQVASQTGAPRANRTDWLTVIFQKAKVGKDYRKEKNIGSELSSSK